MFTILTILWLLNYTLYGSQKKNNAITVAITKLLVGYNFTLFVFSSPGPSTPPPKEDEWSDIPSEVVHLTDSTFDDFMANNPSVLVMFYAPCKYTVSLVSYFSAFFSFVQKSTVVSLVFWQEHNVKIEHANCLNATIPSGVFAWYE